MINIFALREEKIGQTLIYTRLAWFAAAEEMKQSIMVLQIRISQTHFLFNAPVFKC